MMITTRFEDLEKTYNRPIMGNFNAPRVRIREEPTLNGANLGYSLENQIIEIIGETDDEMTIGDMVSKWYRIITADGLSGWSFGHFIDLGGEVLFDESQMISIFRFEVPLYEGSKSKLLFNKDNQVIRETEWLSSSDLITFEKEERIILGDTYYPSDVSYTYIFDINGNTIKEFKNPGITYRFGQVEDSPLFYIIIFDGMNDSFYAQNKCIIYDQDGSIVNQFIYTDEQMYQFEYAEIIYSIELIQPEVP